jgi:hypothetical protein
LWRNERDKASDPSVFNFAAVPVAPPLLGHHAFTSEFTESKLVTVKGVLTRVDWINPHAYMYVDVKEQGGNVKAWTIETFPPSALRRAGMERDMLKVGDSVILRLTQPGMVRISAGLTRFNSPMAGPLYSHSTPRAPPVRISNDFAICDLEKVMRTRFLIYIATVLFAVSSSLALRSAAQQAGSAEVLAGKVKEASARPTPRSPDGHPDLSGYWTTGVGGGGLITKPSSVSADGKTLQLGISNEIQLCDRAKAGYRRRVENPALRPSYKPEFQAKQKALLTGPHYLDPAFRCLPIGIPRIGPPQEIFQTATAVVFLYATQQRNLYRVIPIDGRDHHKDADYMAMGDSIGYWDGEILVVDVTKLTEDTWLDGDGSFHDKNLHVVERFSRQGNTLHYDVIVEDPTLFTQAWKPTQRTLILGSPGEHVKEDYPCVESSSPHMVNGDRH